MVAPTDAVLSTQVVRVGVCAYLDVAGDPLRFALAPAAVTTPVGLLSILPAEDADFDGQTFDVIDPAIMEVSPVKHALGGVEAVTFTVSGTLELDSGLMTRLSDPTMFRGRVAKLWMVRFDDNWAPTHARPYYAGYMAVPAFHVAPDQQIIQVVAENYLTLLGSGAPSRSLLWTPDPNDHAGDATVGATGAGSALGPQYGQPGHPSMAGWRPF